MIARDNPRPLPEIANRRQGTGSNGTIAVLGAAVLLGLVLIGAGAGLGAGAGTQATPQTSDPGVPLKDAALSDARAAARLDWHQVWLNYCPGFRAANPERQWSAAQRQSRPVVAPADTQFDVVAIRGEGPYYRVEVRVTAPGYAPQDGEIVYRPLGSTPWVKVDEGPLGHTIHDACGAGSG
jgi:hypothetical protein